MPQRRYGSARRELDWQELQHLVIGSSSPFADEVEAEHAYWQHRERILTTGNFRDGLPGRRPWAFWRFEARYDPDEGRRGFYRENEDLHLDERNQLRWLIDHNQLGPDERDDLLAHARGERYCPLREEILLWLGPGAASRRTSR